VTLLKRDKKNHPVRLRMVRPYLLAILICTFLLFSVSLISLVQQQYIIRERSRSNLEFLSQRIAADLEQRIQSIAAETLSKSWIDTLRYQPKDELVPAKARELRMRFEELRRTHPIAADPFIFVVGSQTVFRFLALDPFWRAEDFLPVGQLGSNHEVIHIEPYQINSRAFRRGTRICQMYYAALPGDKPSETAAVGFEVSLPWVREHLLPEFSNQLGPSTSAFLVDDMAQADNAEDINILLRTIGWKLQIPASSINRTEATANQELWFIGVATGMFLCVLGMGIYLLVRVSEDIRWYQIRSDFVSGISHDLKTPLSLIRLYSETLEGDEQRFSPEERRSFIRIIARESERLSRLIDNVLDFSKIEQGRKRYEMREGDLAEAVKQTVEDYISFPLVSWVPITK